MRTGIDDLDRVLAEVVAPEGAEQGVDLFGRRWRRGAWDRPFAHALRTGRRALRPWGAGRAAGGRRGRRLGSSPGDRKPGRVGILRGVRGATAPQRRRGDPPAAGRTAGPGADGSRRACRRSAGVRRSRRARHPAGGGLERGRRTVRVRVAARPRRRHAGAGPCRRRRCPSGVDRGSSPCVGRCGSLGDPGRDLPGTRTTGVTDDEGPEVPAVLRARFRTPRLPGGGCRATGPAEPCGVGGAHPRTHPDRRARGRDGTGGGAAASTMSRAWARRTVARRVGLPTRRATGAQRVSA